MSERLLSRQHCDTNAGGLQAPHWPGGQPLPWRYANTHSARASGRAGAVTTPATEQTEEAPRKRRRLTAAARKSSILAAARRAFIETGDMSGTSIRVIAEHSGIS